MLKTEDFLKYLLFITLVLSQLAFAGDASNCYSISNSDSKNYCLAAAKNEKSYCYSISDSDRKNMCLAQVGRERSYCYSISSSDAKNQCLAFVK